MVGAPSASARGGALIHRAGYHLFRVHEEDSGFRISAELRGLDAGGLFASQGAIDISPGAARRAGARA